MICHPPCSRMVDDDDDDGDDDDHGHDDDDEDHDDARNVILDIVFLVPIAPQGQGLSSRGVFQQSACVASRERPPSGDSKPSQHSIKPPSHRYQTGLAGIKAVFRHADVHHPQLTARHLPQSHAPEAIPHLPTCQLQRTAVILQCHFVFRTTLFLFPPPRGCARREYFCQHVQSSS